MSRHSVHRQNGVNGIGLAGLNTTNEVYNACTSGREQQCGKIAVKGYGNFAASTSPVFGWGMQASVSPGQLFAGLRFYLGLQWCWFF